MRTLALPAIVLFAAAAHADPAADSRVGNSRIVSFQTMYGVDGPFVGDTDPIRGVVSDELPWVVVTDGFPANASGDAFIDAQLELPTLASYPSS